MLESLVQLIQLSGHLIRPYLKQIMDFVINFWPSHADERGLLADLICAAAKVLGGELRPFLSIILLMADDFFDENADYGVQSSCIAAWAMLGCNCDEYIHMIAPILIQTIENSSAPLSLRYLALSTTCELARQIPLVDYMSAIVHAVLRILQADSGKGDLSSKALELVCVLFEESLCDFEAFVPVISQVCRCQPKLFRVNSAVRFIYSFFQCLRTFGITNDKYETLIKKLYLGEEPIIPSKSTKG
jgi:FKBP12-rapamycin complex-associated protein